MAFSDSQILKVVGNAIAAGVLDSSGANWYETRNPNSFIVDPASIWSDLPLMKDFHAANFAEAVQHAVNNPEYFELVGINPDGTFDDSTAIQLTPIAGTNNATYIAYNTYNDPTSGVRNNFILPHLIPRPNGAPSAAYQATIWSGPPSAGQPVLTSTGNDGNWVSHIWNSSGGLLLISPNDAPPSASFPTTDLYVTGICYGGQTGGGGGFSGDTVLLQDPEGQWRIRNEYPHLLFERKEINEEGLPVWNTYSSMGNSIATDGVKLHRPYNISVDDSSSLNDVTDFSIDPDFKSVFRVAGTNDAFIYGNTQRQTVIETQKGTDIKRAAAIREELEIENRPLSDVEIVLDTTDNPEDGSFKELSWVSDIDFADYYDFIRFNKIAFEVVESSDDTLGAPLRISVEFPDGRLIQENLTFTALNSGINGGFNLKTGFDFNNITPKYTDIRTAVTITRIQLADGYKVKLTGGIYDYVDPDDGLTKQQLVPRQKSLVEFSNDSVILDESNLRETVYNNTGLILDNGVHLYNEEFLDELFPLVSGADHTNAYNPVLGNYEDSTFIASGMGGVKVLFEDSTTRTQFWTQGDKERIASGSSPQFWKELTEIEFDVSGIFNSELNERGWEIVNVENFLPLIRYEGSEPTGYRVEVQSTIVDYQFQESQDTFEFIDGKIKEGFDILPTIDAIEPEYVKLRLPRSRYTVNFETPRKIKYQFMDPVKVYGYYKDPADPNDVTTGTFVPSIKSDVIRVFEESIVSGDDLEERVDLLQGEKEYQEALENNYPTLHLFPSKLVLADKDGEWLFFGDAATLYSNQDEFQYLFNTGAEAYFELDSTQGNLSGDVFIFNPVVVGVPTDAVAGFEASFGWHESLSSNNNLSYGVFTMYIDSGGRGFDSKIKINIPVNTSINWRFRRRRDGSYSYIATPMNDNLSSTWLGVDNDLSAELPVDPNPPN